MSDNDVLNDPQPTGHAVADTAEQAVPQAQQAQEAPASQPQPQQGPQPRRRLQELLAIPDSQRTDAQWDELIELEIQMAPGNRVGAGPMPGTLPRPGQGRQGGHHPRPIGGGGQRSGGGGGAGGGGGGQPTGGQPAGGKKPFKKFRKGPPKPKAP